MIARQSIDSPNLHVEARRGFTLVEMLIVMVIFLMLVAISLPIVKGLISDQKVTRTAQNIEAFINAARSRAVAEGRIVGVRFERLGDTNYTRSTCVRLRQLVGVPPYTGDASNAVAELPPNILGTPVGYALFNAADSPLLLLSSINLQNGDGSDDYLAPIQKGDLLELPGGRSVSILDISGNGPVRVDFSLPDPAPVPGYTVNRFPSAGIVASGQRNMKYRIHRTPMPSTSNVMSLPQGMAIDLNYSGVAIAGAEFAPALTGVIKESVDILFNSSGAITQVIYDDGNTRVYPTGLIYFCVGEIDGVANVNGVTAAARDNLFSQDRTLTTNLMNPDALWVVVNPASGRVTTVPMATPGAAPADPTDPTTAAFGSALGPARILATYSDTVAE